MSLLRWIGVNSNGGNQSTQSISSPNAPQNQQWWNGSDEKYFGMENFGNTCYANSVLQALYFCKPFRQLLELSSSDTHLIVAANNTSLSTSPQSFSHLPIPNASTSQNNNNNNNHPNSSSSSSSSSIPPSHIRPKSTSLGLDTLQKIHHTAHPNSSSSSSSPSSPSPLTRPRSQSNQPHFPSKNQQATHQNHHLKSDPSTSQPHSTSQTTTTNHKRNWGAADFDQGGLGKQHLPSPNSTNLPLPTGTTTSARPDPSSDDPTICSSLRDLFRHISTQPNSVGAVAPQAFINTLKRYNELFRSTMHQDAHEFLNYLVNSVAEDVFAEQEKRRLEDEGLSLLEPTPPSLQKTSFKAGQSRSTWVHRLFEGVLTNETKCLTCETVTQRDESFLDLSINIHQNTSLTACLRQFSASEMLCQKNKFSCDQCCSLQEAEKRMKIKKLPNVLALHLKRFKYQENLQRYTKLTYRVVFPFELKLFNTTDDIQDPDRLYELWAIVVHIGAGPHHGHYVTILKSHGQWLLFDDNVVTRIEERDIQKYYGDTPGAGSGYVLFYQATDLDLMDLIGVPLGSDGVEMDSELETEGSEEAVIPACDDTTPDITSTAENSMLKAESKNKSPQLSTWNGFQLAPVAPTRTNSTPFSSCLSSASSSSSHPLPPTSQQRNIASPTPSARTISTSDQQYEHPTSSNSNRAAESAAQQLPQLGPNHSPNPNSKATSPQLKFSGSSKLSRSHSVATKFSSLARTGSHLVPKPIDGRLSPQSSPDSALLSPFQTGPSLPKSVCTSAPLRTIPHLPSPHASEDPAARATLPNYQPTSPLIGTAVNSGSGSGNSNSKTSAALPKLHRKFSAKFLRRKKSSANSPAQSTNTADPSPHSSPTVGSSDSVMGPPSSARKILPSRHDPAGPPQHFFSPRPIQGSYRHSIATALDVSMGDANLNGVGSLLAGNRHSVHSAEYNNHEQGAWTQMTDTKPSRPVSMVMKGAQAPPATSSLTEKQQREIKKASDKASKMTVKDKLRALTNSQSRPASQPSTKAAKLAAQFKFTKSNQSFEMPGAAHDAHHQQQQQQQPHYHQPRLGGSPHTASQPSAGRSMRLRSNSSLVAPTGSCSLGAPTSSSSPRPAPATYSGTPSAPNSVPASSSTSRPSGSPPTPVSRPTSRHGSSNGFLT
ncbi:hypothetical protein PCASD_01863 [Puccinia coronata f. sp. avenae]|uniref:ubiquitinyl hydrolase 1 n=1 Tax=Puccinia coronata f. sp. avenae TaxID=200324 RepID=A0A2N5VJL6_9BASI|nr:hypothetical protein PCASD_01863 [Puccinia coronata f. sp. avenae]